MTTVKQANDDDLGPIEGLDVLAGNDTVFVRCLELGGYRPIWSRHTWSGPRCGRSTRPRWPATGAHAHELDAELQPIYEATAVTSNPIPVKAALEMLGIVEGNLRLPMVPASDDERATIRAALERQGLLVSGGTT